jgi:hypothetical protein
MRLFSNCPQVYTNSPLRPVWLAYEPPFHPAVLFSQYKPATSNQSAVLFSQKRSAPDISHQPNEHAVNLDRIYFRDGPLVWMAIIIFENCPVLCLPPPSTAVHRRRARGRNREAPPSPPQTRTSAPRCSFLCPSGKKTELLASSATEAETSEQHSSELAGGQECPPAVSRRGPQVRRAHCF